MDKLTLNPAMAAKLAALEEPVALCRADGQVYGWFQPVGKSDEGDHRARLRGEDEVTRDEEK